MRLVNADELKERLLIDSDLVEVYDGVMVPCIDFEYNIDNAPTIKAIPVEWIEQWVGALKERSYHCYQILMPALIEMLENWEKENETSKC